MLINGWLTFEVMQKNTIIQPRKFICNLERFIPNRCAIFVRFSFLKINNFFNIRDYYIYYKARKILCLDLRLILSLFFFLDK